MEARGVSGGKELLRIRRTASAAHLLRYPQVEIEDAVVTASVAVAAVSCCMGRGCVQDVHTNLRSISLLGRRVLGVIAGSGHRFESVVWDGFPTHVTNTV